MSQAARAATAARLIEADLESPNGTSTEPAKSGVSSSARARQHLEEFRRDLDAVTAEILEAEIDLAENDVALALTRAGAAVAVSPNSASAHYVLGVAKFRAGDVTTANSEWHTAVDCDSNFFPARLALAQHDFSSADAEAAEEEVVPVVREEPGNIRALLLYARTLAARARLDAAEIIANRALAVTEANPEPHIVLGEIALARNNTANALSEYEQAVIVAPDSQDAIEGLINAYRRGNVTREMLQRMEALGQEPPHSATILEIVGRIYADRGWREDAQRALKASLAAEPHRSTAALALARVYTDEGRISAAENSALLIGDHTSELLAATRAQQNNDLDSAIQKYESAVREGETTGVAANNLAWIYAQRGERLQRALALAESARSKAPQNPAFLDTVGFVQLQRREYSAAVRTLKQAVQLAVHDGETDPALPQIVAHLAQARRLAGDTGEQAGRNE
jgi:tetratricopeptide (TPR) repeat protein